MESLADDELLSVFDKIHDERDKFSFYRVSKQFLKVASIRLRRLHTSFPCLLKDILHAFPHLVEFQSYESLQNTHMELVARSCPNLQFLRLSCFEKFDSDFDDDGLCVVANACSRLNVVELHGRLNVGDVGVGCLVRSCKDLRVLKLSRCVKVTDESLKYIGKLNRLEDLYLSCCQISDTGLKYLTEGDYLKNNLKTLHLHLCDRITDDGTYHLKQMVNLTSLNLSMCFNITHYGILELCSHIPNVHKLDLSMLDVSDSMLSHISSNCKKLMDISLSYCKKITGEGLRHFAHHPKLKRLTLFSCHNFYEEDLKSVILACSSLRTIRLSRSIKTPISNPCFFDEFQNCRIEWEY